MRTHSVDLRVSLVVIVVLALPLAAGAGQTARTPGGVPDLQGLWTNSTTTPLERPQALADTPFLTDEEVAELDAQAVGRNDRPPRPGDPGTYNEFWWERGTRLRQTSLVVDPPDGRIPEMTAAGRARARWARGGDSWTNRSLAERCITRGAPKRPGGYNNNFLMAPARTCTWSSASLAWTATRSSTATPSRTPPPMRVPGPQRCR